MRETGPVRLRIEGNQTTGSEYVNTGRKLLGILKVQMASLQLKQLERAWSFSDGVVVVVSSVYGQDTIQINAPEVTTSLGAESAAVSSSLDELQYPFAVFPSSDTVTYKTNAINLVLAGGTASFGAKNGAVVATLDTVRYKVFIDALVRMMKLKQYDQAENLARSLDDVVANTGSMSDVALNCADGFFIDPTLTAGALYGDYLSKNVSSSHMRAFSHTSFSLPPYQTDAFYRQQWPANNAVYNAAFVQYDLPIPSVLTDYGDTPPAARHILVNIMNQGAGGALVAAPGFSTIDFSSGVSISEEFYLRQSVGRTFSSTHKYVDLIQAKAQLIQRNYHVTFMTSPTGPMVTNPVYFGDHANGPNEGATSATFQRVKAVRGVNGWSSTTTPIQPVTVQRCVLSADTTPGVFITPPPLTDAVVARHENGDGSAFDFAQVTYSRADLKYAAGGAPLAFGSVFPTPPKGNYSNGFNLEPSFYNAASPAVSLSTAGNLQEFTSTRGLRVVLGVDGVVRVTGADGVAIGSLSVQAASAITGPFNLDAVNWSQPAGAPDLTTFLAATRVNVALQYVNPARVAQPVYAPPSAQPHLCVYQPSSDKLMYFTLLDPSFPTGILGFIQAQNNYLNAVLTRTGKDAALAALLALVRIDINTGLPLTFVALAQTLISPVTVLL